jgi:hypothetical protein
MPHFARIFFIAFASLAASCASERAQKEATEREEALRPQGQPAMSEQVTFNMPDAKGLSVLLRPPSYVLADR